MGPPKAFAPSEAPPKEPVGTQHGATTEDAGVREEETQTSRLYYSAGQRSRQCG